LAAAKRSNTFERERERVGEINMPPNVMDMSKDRNMSIEMGMNGRGGHLYMQTNEVKNAIIHYHRSANGTLTEVERVPTGGAGSGTYKPISGEESAPNAFEGAGSVIPSPDRRFLFATNGGENSVSSFAVDKDGRWSGYLTGKNSTQGGDR
jgi:6-phosphogluconolactonase (cycloisomerase 2 family)